MIPIHKGLRQYAEIFVIIRVEFMDPDRPVNFEAGIKLDYCMIRISNGEHFIKRPRIN